MRAQKPPSKFQMTYQTNTTGASAKPAILCLHGGGTNEAIFRVQTMRIQNALSSHFDFVFLDAPFESAPGPGVLPVFEGCGPYFRWVLEKSPAAETPRETTLLLDRVARAQKAKDGRGFVGVLGFSQGARLAAGLLLEQQLGTGLVDWGAGGLCFGVLCNGVSPPLTARLAETARIAMPTLHVVGLEDPWRDESRKLMSAYCEQEHAVLLEFNVGHRFPILKEDTAKVAAEILRMYADTSGRSPLNPSSFSG